LVIFIVNTQVVFSVTNIFDKVIYSVTRRRGRPKMRWLDDVSMDLRKMGLNEWKDRARNREA